MKITQKEKVEVQKEIGYECDVCHKKVIWNLTFPQRNTIICFIKDAFGESNIKEVDICSMECLTKALNNIYSNVEIVLSYDFLESQRK